MESHLFATVARALSAAVGVASSQDRLDVWLPEESNPAGEAPTVREAARGAAYDLVFVPHTLGGRALDDDAPAEKGDDLLGDDPAAAVAALVDGAVAAAAAHADAESTTHLSYGDFPARDYLRDITGYYGILAVDVAKVTGVQPAPELVEGLYAHLEPMADDWRAIGVFGPRVDVADDAPLLDRLRGLTGRQP